MKFPDIFTRHDHLFVENQSLKSRLAEADRANAQLREMAELLLEQLDALKPDSITAYCVRAALDGEIGFVVRGQSLIVNNKEISDDYR